MPKPQTLVRCPTLAQVPVHYSRPPVAPYGERGKARRPRCTPEFKAKLEACLEELRRVCPLGRPEVLVTAGMFIDRPDPNGTDRHAQGTAVDIDSLWWGEPALPLVTKRAPYDAGRYLGVEAVLRMHFGCVLGHWYNRPHEDHWHVDDHEAVGFRASSKARVAFVQASCLYVHGLDIGPAGLDKIYGRDTRAAVAQVIHAEVGGTDWSLERDPGEWLAFLRATFLQGWGCAEDPWA